MINLKLKSYLRYFVIIIMSVVFIGYSNQLIFASEDETGGQMRLSNPLGNSAEMKDPNIVIGKIINSVLGVVGTIALAMFIYGGFRWMTSAGEKDGVTAGKETIKYAAFGLIIIFMAYAIINFLLKDILLPG